MKILLSGLLLFLIGSALAEAQPIPVAQAFALNAKVQQHQLHLDWAIAPGYQLYKQRVHIKLMSGAAVTLGSYQLPVGTPHHDAILGNYQAYEGGLNISIPIWNYQPDEFRVLVGYQGCSSAGYCYPPQRKILTVQLSQFGAQIASIADAPLLAAHTTAPITPAHKNLFLILLTFFGFGLLLAFTPCVLPMIPILSGIIVGSERSPKQAFSLSLTYVLAMAVTYAVAGLLAGLAGKNLQAALQTPWVLITFTVLFISLALSLFGLYELRLPHSWNSKITMLSNKQKSGSYLGVAVMGALSVLIVSPCISAPLVAALAYITQSDQAALGGVILFVMGLGMGVPLLFIGTLGGKFLPKAGHWMHTIKTIFGVLLLITAVWLLYRLLPGYICLLLWGLIAVVSAIYLGALSWKRFVGWQRLWQCILLLWLLTGLILVVGGIGGNQDPLHPLSSKQNAHHLQFKAVKTVAELNQALNKAHGKIVLIDFYADWCVSCKLMEQNVFNQTDVQQALQNVILIRADVTANDTMDKALQKHLGVYAPPTIIFFNRQGQMQQRVTGEMGKKKFLRLLQRINER
jgi:thiol:disulfide interchange protein DsbD